MLTANINGTQLAYQVEEVSPDAPWIVFGNSLVTNLSVWGAQAEALRGHCNVLRYDQRGHGDSALSPVPVDFNLLGSDLLRLLDQCGIQRCVYVGLSMGVPTGLAAYSEAPERFEALVFMDGQASSAPNAIETWGERIDFAQEKGMLNFAQATAQRWLTPDSHAERLGPLERMISATPLEGFVAGATALQKYDYAEVIKQIDCPVQCIAGAEDGKMPENLRGLAAQLEGADFEAIDNAGHVPCFEQPAAVNRVLTGFLQRVGAWQ
ncbi:MULTISPECIES: alpha/beta fold hydrolase [Halomonadaceae]|jgi:3-oxoadipate enol-lactonase|uniref:alpha/beta fold hydrolase n=1 Tax=Halomonadaceae TaxID=28256 RepID=UPI0012EF3548|nr:MULTISPECIES: alpha/beta fold hydrolase [Halomonas]QNU64306.1 alpha/beta fold hydrolase [Halomonas titanicae]CAD5258829.1 3-oxoadipate enol-lactonase [Halomonas sp. 59]CAD5259063.1 3-oxoadipate enol-lactonase [Halomonas sp. 113]CAD5272994.1 Beta-ketoadipate enol-lactone hydrolase [Halomonas sp. I3]CAD5289612.1 3-oxoadipate enol-lactonase [Halomonas sp. 156]